MQLRRVVHIIIGATLLIAPDLAEAQPTWTSDRVVASGRTQKIAYFNAIDPTCRSMGAMAISLIEEPHAGKVQLAQGQEYPNFTTLNSRSRCNTRRLPATQVLYTAAPGYVGSDEFALEVVGPLGAARRIRYRIAVR